MHTHPPTPRSSTGRLGWRRLTAISILAIGAVTLGWTWWAEAHPRQERALRVFVHQQLEQLFPESMSIERDSWYGLIERRPATPETPARVLLVHGLDEPGTIWDDLIPALDKAGLGVWEFRYPNDQGVDQSTRYLAKLWPQLPKDLPIALIGHSMGGLVIRDFVTTWLTPSAGATHVQNAPLLGVILVGTPNHGSEWARLRVWLELRDHLSGERERHFSLFSALRDGTGEAKIDLRPGSDFLETLNARPWPAEIPIQLIGGRLIRPTETMEQSIATTGGELGSDELTKRLGDWWSSLDKGLGDGVVTRASLSLPNADPPILVDGSHRRILLRAESGDPQPPAIAPILKTLEHWIGARRNH